MSISPKSLTIHLKPPTVAAMFAKITFQNGCWIWNGSKDPKGYGRVSIKYITKRPLLVHRVMFAWLVEPLVDARVIDHYVCNNPSCCNPEHLELVTQKENILRGRWGDNSRKTHCKRNHKLPLSDKSGLRRCRICINFTRRRREHLRKVV